MENKHNSNKLMEDIIEYNLPTETKVELINTIVTEKSYISRLIRFIALRLGLEYFIGNME